MNPEDLLSEWRYCKEVEKNATTRRREIEDELAKVFKVNPASEGVLTIAIGDTNLKVTSRLDRKVDPVKVQELAAEHGIEFYLSTLFRWSPDVNVSVWKATSPEITEALAPAITVKPGRPSFSIKE